MNIKLKIIRIQLELLRSIMNILLNFKKPTNKMVIYFSHKLDKIIVKYHKFIANSNELTVNDNETLFINNLVHILKLKIKKIPTL